MNFRENLIWLIVFLTIFLIILYLIRPSKKNDLVVIVSEHDRDVYESKTNRRRNNREVVVYVKDDRLTEHKKYSDFLEEDHLQVLEEYGVRRFVFDNDLKKDGFVVDEIKDVTVNKKTGIKKVITDSGVYTGRNVSFISFPRSLSTKIVDDKVLTEISFSISIDSELVVFGMYNFDDQAQGLNYDVHLYPDQAVFVSNYDEREKHNFHLHSFAQKIIRSFKGYMKVLYNNTGQRIELLDDSSLDVNTSNMTTVHSLP